MLNRWSLPLVLMLASALTGCDRAADLIPGDGDHPRSATPPPIEAPPLLAPGSLRLAGSAGDAANRPVIPDAELGKTLLVVHALDGEGKTVRNGGGVLVDRQQQLVLTSYQLVRPFRADGTRAYRSLAAGPAAGGATAEFNAALVAANPQGDIAVLRLTGVREGQSGSPPTTEAVLADSSTLRRGDRLRFLAQPSVQRTGPVQVTNGALTGFSGDGLGDPRAYLKTDARLVGTAIGSPVFDHSGALVGVASQLSYDPGAPVALVRPLAKALETINQAKSAPVDARYAVPLQHLPSISGAGGVGRDGVVIAKPVFAENALEGPGFRDLFDYTNIFKRDAPQLAYEYIAQGVPQGALIQELWYLNGVLQDSLSSSYTWSKGSFAIVSDRLTTPSGRGVPNGTWTMEVWVAGAVRATGTAYVGITPPDVPRKPSVEAFRFAATANGDQQPGERLAANSEQLLLFFDYRQAAAVQSIRWIVMRDGRTVFQSATLPWNGGDQGTWWVGYPGEPDGIGKANWEVQIYMDNQSVGTARTSLR